MCVRLLNAHSRLEVRKTINMTPCGLVEV